MDCNSINTRIKKKLFKNGINKVISHGYKDYDNLKIAVDDWLKSITVSLFNNGNHAKAVLA
ncbi:hypothetical protein ASD98_12930 [Flavobacterium sp. Root186]|nr:hypothetical protein ASD98_12930 [Flavobacterium sp. Root186]